MDRACKLPCSEPAERAILRDQQSLSLANRRTLFWLHDTFSQREQKQSLSRPTTAQFVLPAVSQWRSDSR
jgi:hypothetical protein